jgi:hypothetical protein
VLVAESPRRDGAQSELLKRRVLRTIRATTSC